MKKNRLFRIIGLLDEDLIERADEKTRLPAKRLFVRWGAVAACAILAVGIGFAFHRNAPSPSQMVQPPAAESSRTEPAATEIRQEELPILTIDQTISGTMGFEGYCAYEIGDLVGENPCTAETGLTHLPVFENPLAYNEMQRVDNPDFDAMKELLRETAGRLGMDTERLAITDDRPDEQTKEKMIEKITRNGGKVPEGYFDIGSFFMEDGNIKVEVDTQLTVTVHFNPAAALPDGYRFTHFSSYEEKYRAAQYLQEEYQSLLNMRDPVINITGGDYTYDGDQIYQIEFFDGAGGKIEQIIHYNFHTVSFSCDDDGRLFLVRFSHPDLSKKIGDYPIVGEDEAIELLKSGRYITTVPEQFPGEEWIRRTELIYRSGAAERIYMPYYRVYVELPDMKRDNGLNTYGAYYIPAVEESYIEEMPLWDGSFN